LLTGAAGRLDSCTTGADLNKGMKGSHGFAVFGTAASGLCETVPHA